jgi:N-acetylneuraminic acid mutarotase
MFQPERVTWQILSSWRIGKLTSFLSLLLLLAGVWPRLAAQVNEWTWMNGSNSINQPSVYGTQGVPAAGNVPGARRQAVSWTDASGNLWLFGGWGFNASGVYPDYLNDLWMFTPSTGEWTWVSGSNSVEQPGVYGTQGVPAAGNVPGAHSSAVSWTDASGNLWLFGGWGYDANGLLGDLNDLWKYTPSTGEWTWMSGSNSANQPGVYGTRGVPAAGNVPGARQRAVSWTDSRGNPWLFGGGGYDGVGNGGWLNDLWRYTPSTGNWTWMNGSNSINQLGSYGTKGVPTGGYPGARYEVVSWTDSSGNVWFFGGEGMDVNHESGVLGDPWMYAQSSGKWTWMSGSNLVNQPGVYGTQGLPDAGNVPGSRHSANSWMDSSGNLWLFGGIYKPAPRGEGPVNDLWKYTPSTGEWTWMSGPSSADYGTRGVPAADNVPGARDYTVTWTDSGGNVWLFGGSGNPGLLNDLWKYGPTSPSTPSLTTPAPHSTLSGSTVTFGWYAGQGPTRFVLRLGTTVFGSMDVYSPSPTTATTAQVSAIPTNGAYLYARLWYYVNGAWQYVDATYTEAGAPTPPAFTTPAPGSTLPGSTVTFGWDPGGGATRFVLRLGTTGSGSSDVYSGPSTTSTSVQVTTVPTNGAMLYARLWYYLNGIWQYVDATYGEASQ